MTHIPTVAEQLDALAANPSIGAPKPLLTDTQSTWLVALLVACFYVFVYWFLSKFYPRHIKPLVDAHIRPITDPMNKKYEDLRDKIIYAIIENILDTLERLILLVRIIWFFGVPLIILYLLIRII